MDFILNKVAHFIILLIILVLSMHKSANYRLNNLSKSADSYSLVY